MVLPRGEMDDHILRCQRDCPQGISVCDVNWKECPPPRIICPFITYEIAVADFLSIRKKCLDERMSDKAAPAKDVILHKIALL